MYSFYKISLFFFYYISESNNCLISKEDGPTIKSKNFLYYCVYSLNEVAPEVF